MKGHVRSKDYSSKLSEISEDPSGQKEDYHQHVLLSPRCQIQKKEEKGTEEEGSTGH